MNPRLLIPSLVTVLAAVTGQPTLRGQDAGAILEAARMNPTTHSGTLRAQIRSENGVTPLIIRLKEGVIRYEFTDPKQIISLKLSPNETQLSEQFDKSSTPLPPSRRHDPIRRSGITYQDLSLGFLYWPHPVIQGEETVKTRPSWKIDLQAPRTEPLYGVARVWIDKETGAILRIEGYDKSGRLLRRFEIISGQQIDGYWTLKQMRIESFDPGNSHDATTRNYLEILGKL